MATMGSAPVRVVTDPRAAEWLIRRLDAAPGGSSAGTRVGQLLPAGFAAYLRVLHPVSDGQSSLTWAQVAARRGRRLHALAAWDELALAGVGEPSLGSLPVEQLAALCDVLAGHTADPDDCTFALWRGWPGWTALALPADPPGVRFAGREHVLVGGPLGAAVPLSFSDTPGRWWAQSPTGIWPADRAWCVTTDPDRRCTLVAGTVALAEDLLAASELEVWPVDPRDVLPS